MCQTSGNRVLLLMGVGACAAQNLLTPPWGWEQPRRRGQGSRSQSRASASDDGSTELSSVDTDPPSAVGKGPSRLVAAGEQRQNRPGAGHEQPARKQPPSKAPAQEPAPGAAHHMTGGQGLLHKPSKAAAAGKDAASKQAHCEEGLAAKRQTTERKASSQQQQEQHQPGGAPKDAAGRKAGSSMPGGGGKAPKGKGGMLSPWSNGMESARNQRQAEESGRQQQVQSHQQERGAKQARQHDAHLPGRPKHDSNGGAANGKARPAPVQQRVPVSSSGVGGKVLEAGKARSSGNELSATTVAMRLLPSDCFEN